MLKTNIELKPKVEAFLNEEIKMFINGEFVSAIGGKTFETYNPATEEVLAVVCEAQEEDIDAAVKAARSHLNLARGQKWLLLKERILFIN